MKAPGDDKYGKVHSPLHAMLNPPTTKTQEEKREDKHIKGPKPAREGKNWANKRTPVTEFITTKLLNYDDLFGDHWPGLFNIHTGTECIPRSIWGRYVWWFSSGPRGRPLSMYCPWAFQSIACLFTKTRDRLSTAVDLGKIFVVVLFWRSRSGIVYTSSIDFIYLQSLYL